MDGRRSRWGVDGETDFVEREDREEKEVTVQSLGLWHLVGVGSVRERTQGLSGASVQVCDHQRVEDCLSLQSEGRTPAESQLVRDVSWHLIVTRG